MLFCLVDQMQLGSQNFVMEMQFLLEEILVSEAFKPGLALTDKYWIALTDW